MLTFVGNEGIYGEGEELKLFKFERNIRAVRRSLKGAKENGS